MQVERQDRKGFLDLNGNVLDRQEREADEEHSEYEHWLRLVLPPRVDAELAERAAERKREQRQPYPEEAHARTRVAERNGRPQQRLGLAERHRDGVQGVVDRDALLVGEGLQPDRCAEGDGREREVWRERRLRSYRMELGCVGLVRMGAERRAHELCLHGLALRRVGGVSGVQVATHDPAVHHRAGVDQVVRNLPLHLAADVCLCEGEQAPLDRSHRRSDLPRHLRAQDESGVRGVRPKDQQQAEHRRGELKRCQR
mmetsp:Transcript_12502/g.32761  ORF Transcript_12502/g.32761 Transcript_12502/m.32761 type:complete len:256 (+) Transcript_12502:317-1084(+)